MPLQNAINKFFRALGQTEQVPTASAYSQARGKIDGELFIELNHALQGEFYKKDEGYKEVIKLWNGWRVLGVDATILNLPDTEELRRLYSISRNQEEVEHVQAQASILYDLLNDMPLNSELDRQKAERDYIFESHEEYIEPGDVLLLDMAYADYSVMAYLSLKKKKFVIRAPLKHTFKQVSEFALNRTRTDETFTLKNTDHQRQRVKRKRLPEEIQLRMLKVELEEGKDEILLTNLFDKNLSENDFKELYSKRWNQETYFNRIKNLFEIERFSGLSNRVIKQDFYGTVFLTALESLLVKDTERDLREKSMELKYERKVNRSVSIGSMIDYTVELLLTDNKTTGEVIEELKLFLSKNPVLVKPGRKYERKTQNPYKKLWAYKYKKKKIS